MQGGMLPLLAQNTSQVIHVWSAGCASGEEVYSFKILWDGMQKSYPNICDI
jgi:chemotaxis methyl-accepting protein methylase